MQLSAPVSFPEMLAPVPGGELPADGVLTSDGGDFAALVEGLVDPASEVMAPNEPAPSTPTQTGENALLAAFAAFVPTLPPAPVSPDNSVPTWLDEGGAETAGTEEGIDLDGEGEATLPPPANGFRPSAGRAFGSMDARGVARTVPVSPSPAEVAEAPAKPAPASAESIPSAVQTASSNKDGVTVPPPAAQAQLATSTVLSSPATSAGNSGNAGQPLRTRRGESVVSESAITLPAKFAADAPIPTSVRQALREPTERNFLTIGVEQLTEVETEVGTDVALSSAPMTASAPTSPSPAFVPPLAGLKDAVVDASVLARFDAQAEVPEQVERLAHRAVEAVTATIERGASQPAHSVNLKFSVEGADLLVRVALRAEEIQVTFRTDSADLRTALAHEWQMVRSRDPESALQSIAPVFTSGDSGNSTSSQGNRESANAFSQLQAQADAHSQRQAARNFNDAPASPAGAARGSSASATTIAPRVQAAEPRAGSRLLHTFA